MVGIKTIPSNWWYFFDFILVGGTAFVPYKVKHTLGIPLDIDISLVAATLLILLIQFFTLFVFKMEYRLSQETIRVRSRFGAKAGHWRNLTDAYFIPMQYQTAFIFIFSDNTRIEIIGEPRNPFKNELENALGKKLWDLDMRFFVKWPLYYWIRGPVSVMAVVLTLYFWTWGISTIP